jgi:predicted Fe-Mo cluster-binding NifX family protein
MKIAFSSQSDTPSSRLDPRFGRCAVFMVFDTEGGEWQRLPNPALSASGGAGPQAAQALAERGVGAVVSGAFGPNAFTALEAADIAMYAADEGRIEDLLRQIQSGELERVSSATVPAHHGGRGRRA